MALQKTPLLTEKIVDLIREKLQADFALRCAETDHQYTDGISVTPPSDDSYFISTKKNALTLPACYIIAGPSTVDYGDDPNYFISGDELLVMVSAEDEDAENLQRKVWRYTRVLYGILNQAQLDDADSRLGAKVIPRRYGTSDGIQTTSLDDGQKRFRQDAVVEFEIYHYEKNLT